jgi:5-formyltetrahydrofolate cyclo-ligase
VEKSEARRQIAEAVRGLTPPERNAKSASIAGRVLSLPEIQPARAVMGFLPMPDELDTRPLLAKLISAGKRVYVPRTVLRPRRMFPVRLTDVESLRIGEYGIMEPAGEETCGPTDLDFIILPGRAFDAKGNRLGRGAGYYDRFLATLSENAVLCGICFDCQVMETVPTDERDRPVDIVVTETRVLRA